MATTSLSLTFHNLKTPVKFFRRVQNEVAEMLAHVCPLGCGNSRTATRIFMKSDSGVFIVLFVLAPCC